MLYKPGMRQYICYPILETPTYHAKCCFELFTVFGCMVTGILLILSFGDNHEEQSLSFLLVHIFEVCTNFSSKVISVCIQTVEISCSVLYGHNKCITMVTCLYTKVLAC